MEAVVGIVILLIFGMPIAALVVALGCMSRVKHLEAATGRMLTRIKSLEAGSVSAAAPGPARKPETQPAIEPSKAQRVAEQIKRTHTPAAPVHEETKQSDPPTPQREEQRAKPQAAGVGWEQRLGAQLPVWIGGIALALAGVFLVRYVATQGLLTPIVRLALAGGAGAVAIGLAQWMHRGWSQIAQALAAAGAATWYAATFSAVNVHELIDPGTGFVLIGVITAAAVGLSLRHGPFVALLGIVGGFVMPGLLGVSDFSAVQLFGYLLVLQIALVGLTRWKKWWWLTAATGMLSFAWVALWVVFWFDASQANIVGLFVLASVGGFVAASWSVRDELAGWPIMTALPYAASVVGLFLSAWLIDASGFDPVQWVYLGALAGGALLLGRLRHEYFGISGAATAITGGLVLLWAMDHPGGDLFPWIVLDFAVIFGVGGYACLYGSRHASRWAGLSIVATLAFTLIGYFFIEGELALPWWAIAGLIGSAYAIGTVPIVMRRVRMADAQHTLAYLLAGVSAFAALALAIYFERAALTVALAIEVLALAAVAWKLRVPELRTLVQLGAGAVAVRLLINPAIFDYTFAAHPVFNGLWYLYGVPAACLLGAAWMSRRDQQTTLARRLEALSAALGFALVTLLVRHGFTGEAMDRAALVLHECATYATVWGALAAGLLGVHRMWPRRAAELGGQVMAMASLAMAVVMCGGALNPLIERADVGSLYVINDLLYIYGVPAALAGVFMVLLRGDQNHALRTLAALACLVLSFILVSLQVRQAFWGVDLLLDGQTPSHGEWYSYSAAWLCFAAGLLATGVISGSHLLRYASLAVMLTAVAKVFVFDTQHLADLWRVVSFLGLGVSLLAVAWAYQRFVFRKEPRRDTAIES